MGALRYNEIAWAIANSLGSIDADDADDDDDEIYENENELEKRNNL